MQSKRSHVNWNKTVETFGEDRIKPKPSDKVIIDCNYCDADYTITYRCIRSRSGGPYDRICKSCQQKRTWASNSEFRDTVTHKNSIKQKEVWNREGYRENQSETQRTLTTGRWEDEEYREKVSQGVKNAHATIDGYTQSCRPEITPELRDKISNNTRQLWQDEEYRNKTVAGMVKNWQRSEYVQKMKAVYADPVYRNKLSQTHRTPCRHYNTSKKAKRFWADNRQKMLSLFQSPEHRQKLKDIWDRPGFREMMSEKMRLKWQDPVYAAKCLNNHSSKLEEHLADLLDTQGVSYVRQHQLGHWSFDFLIHGEERHTLIEVQGEYWHFKKWGNADSPRDKAKATFVEKYHSDRYKLVTVWENEFLSPERLSDRLAEILGKPAQVIPFIFQDLTVQIVSGPEASQFFSRFHYSASGGRAGINIGACLNGKLIACCRYCPPTRKQSADRLGLSQHELRELTKFAIHPHYQKKNLATWFLSRTYCYVPHGAKCLLSFADETFGHTGTIYKSANWQYDGVVPADYVYMDSMGYITHKRTLWGHAKKMRITESAYAQDNGYVQMWGKQKHRFVYWL